MDPFLEAPSLWPDVHNSLIYAFRDQIQKQLNPNYVAVITPYVTFESLEIAPVRRATDAAWLDDHLRQQNLRSTMQLPR